MLEIGNITGNPGVRQPYPDPNPQKPIPRARVRVFTGWGHGFHGFHGSTAEPKETSASKKTKNSFLQSIINSLHSLYHPALISNQFNTFPLIHNPLNSISSPYTRFYLISTRRNPCTRSPVLTCICNPFHTLSVVLKPRCPSPALFSHFQPPTLIFHPLLAFSGSNTHPRTLPPSVLLLHSFSNSFHSLQPIFDFICPFSPPFTYFRTPFTRFHPFPLVFTFYSLV